MTAVGIGILNLLAFTLGAWIALFIRIFSRVPRDRLPSFSKGFLAGLILFTLLPHSLLHYERNWLLLGFMGSVAGVMILRRLYHKSYVTHSFSLIALAVALHTIPLSFAIGTVLADPIARGSLTLSAVFHHIPEAAALTLWLAGQNGNLTKLFFYFALLSGLSIIFVQAGQMIDNPSMISSLLIGMSVGVMALTLLTKFFLGKDENGVHKVSIGYMILGLLGYGFLLVILHITGIK